MDEDKFALVEKILRDVHNILTKNSELCSFDIVPVETNFQNKSPVLHIENCLGLESWCVKHVYMYCYSEIMDKYLSKPKHKGLKLTSMLSDRLARLLDITLLINPELASLWNKRRDLVQQGLLQRHSELKFSKLVLSRKPKCNDAFAYRRWILDAMLNDTWMKPVQGGSPGCPDDEYIGLPYLSLQVSLVSLFKVEDFDEADQRTLQAETLVNEELHICELTADKSPNNYHSWSHRAWLLNQLQTIHNPNLDLLFIKEFEFSQQYHPKHVSDFSCYHYRQFCIQNVLKISDDSYKMLKTNLNVDLRKCLVRLIFTNSPSTNKISEEDLLSYSDDLLVSFLLGKSKNCDSMGNGTLICQRLEILFHELRLNNELLRFYKHHETLWYHRRFIIHEITVMMYEYFGLIRQNGVLTKLACKKCNLDDLNQKQAKIVRYDCSNVYSTVLFNVVICHEKNFIAERRDDLDNYSDRHEKYLKFVEGLNNVM